MADAQLPMLADMVNRESDGPAMSALRPEQRRFVLLFITTNLSEEQAARQAGFKTAGGLMRSPRVLEALREETVRRLAGSAAVGLRVLLTIANDNGHKDQLKAARELLAHAGLAPETKQKIEVTHVGARPEEIKAEIRQLMAQIGPDAQRLLENAGLQITDAEFTPVSLDENGNEW